MSHVDVLSIVHVFSERKRKKKRVHLLPVHFICFIFFCAMLEFTLAGHPFEKKLISAAV